MLASGAFGADLTLGSLLDRVESGEEIVITRHGKPVARLVATSGTVDRVQARAALDQIRALAKEWPAEPFDWDESKKLRDEGRP
jgi:prevent-host-death family protein